MPSEEAPRTGADVRIVAATLRDLPGLVGSQVSGRFVLSADVFTVELPLCAKRL